MSREKYAALKDLAGKVAMYPDPDDAKQVATNISFALVCVELVPVLIKRFEDYCSVDCTTIEEVVEAFGGWELDDRPES